MNITQNDEKYITQNWVKPQQFVPNSRSTWLFKHYLWNLIFSVFLENNTLDQTKSLIHKVNSQSRTDVWWTPMHLEVWKPVSWENVVIKWRNNNGWLGSHFVCLLYLQSCAMWYTFSILEDILWLYSLNFSFNYILYVIE